MSETVHYKGKLKEVKKYDSETLEDQCKRILGSEELESYYKSYEEKLIDEFYDEYIIYDDILYSVYRKSIDPDSDMFKINRRKDGTIDFEVRYYNGGCGFAEAIENALEKESRSKKLMLFANTGEELDEVEINTIEELVSLIKSESKVKKEDDLDYYDAKIIILKVKGQDTISLELDYDWERNDD